MTGRRARAAGRHGPACREAPRMYLCFRRLLCLLLLAVPLLVAAAPRYSNPRYGFSLEVPTGFRPQEESANGDGRVFHSSDGQAEIRVYGSNNVTDEKVGTLAASHLRQCSGTVAYKAQGKNWFVLSWTEKGRVSYLKGWVGSGSLNYLSVAYPKAQAKRYDPIVTRIEASFRPGELSQSH